MSRGCSLQTKNVTKKVVSSGSRHAGVRWASCKELIKTTSKEIRSSSVLLITWPETRNTGLRMMDIWRSDLLD